MRTGRSIGLGCALAVWVAATPAGAQRSLFDEPLKSELQPRPATPPAGEFAPAAPTRTAPPAAVEAPPPVAAQGDVPEEPAAISPTRSKPKPRHVVRPRHVPRPTRLLAIANAGPGTVTAIEVSAEGKSARLGDAIPPNGNAKLKLPAFRTCTVTVTATFQGVAEPSTAEVDICKDRTLHFAS